MSSSLNHIRLYDENERNIKTDDEGKSKYNTKKKSYVPMLSMSAYAQYMPDASKAYTIDSLRQVIMLGVTVVISVFFFICVLLFCFTKDIEKLKFADNMLRTIVCFYIGIVTGLLGLPGKAI